MAETLTNVRIWMDGLDLSGVSNSVSLELSAATPETTVFRGGWVTRAEGGLKTSAFSLEGLYEADQIDEAQFAAIGQGNTFTVAPAGEAYGDVAYVVPTVVAGYTPSGSVGEILATAVAAEGDGATKRAQVLHVEEDVTSDTTTPRRQLGSLAAGERLRVFVHVRRRAGSVDIDLRSHTAMTGGAVTIQDSQNGVNSDRIVELTVDGAETDEHWDLRFDVSGTSDFDVAAFWVIE